MAEMTLQITSSFEFQELNKNLSICPICSGWASGGTAGRRVGNNRPKLITFLCDSGGANRASYPHCVLYNTTMRTCNTIRG